MGVYLYLHTYIYQCTQAPPAAPARVDGRVHDAAERPHVEGEPGVRAGPAEAGRDPVRGDRLGLGLCVGSVYPTIVLGGHVSTGSIYIC